MELVEHPHVLRKDWRAEHNAVQERVVSRCHVAVANLGGHPRIRWLARIVDVKLDAAAKFRCLCTKQMPGDRPRGVLGDHFLNRCPHRGQLFCFRATLV